MEQWQKSLDRYLTSGPPDDGFDDWAESVVNNVEQEFYDENDIWLTSSDNQCNKWLWEFFYNRKGRHDHFHVSRVIQRAHSLYIKNR